MIVHDTLADGVPIHDWSVDIERSAMSQMEDMARLPFAFHHVSLMPDAHTGYAMPIGGVFAADGYVVPYAIGVDIGCSVTLLRIDLLASGLEEGDVKRLMDQVRRDVPVGNGPQAEHQDLSVWERFPIEPNRTQMLDGPMSDIATSDRVKRQLGSLGGGNHFLELQEAVGTGPEEGFLFFMIHSGSRSLGKRICDFHVERAQKLNALWKSQTVSKETAYLPLDSDEGRRYIHDMGYAMYFAQRSHGAMSWLVKQAIEKVWGHDADVVTEVAHCHHNFAAMENHFGRNVLVHRKGAVRARAGETVLIPGSMSTGSFIGRGLGNRDSFETCQHGAGRLRGRNATKKIVTTEDLARIMDEAGVYLTTPGDVRDESAPAYKDIFAVMEASRDLVEPVQQLKPLGVVKG